MLDPQLPYVVILAGGEGNRLAPLTRALYGTDLPKQFAVLSGQHSLMQTTVERAMTLTSPERISVVVSAHHADLARQQLAPYPGVELVVQPRNLDTAPGILLPLVRILVRSFCARVVFLPSDHYIPNAEPLNAALRDAGKSELADRLVMVGVAPAGPEVDYGWIVRGRRIGGTAAHDVERFQEKPSAETAEDLWRRGGLWNTFIQAGPARRFWDLAREHVPVHAAAFERYGVAIGGLNETEALDAAYRALPAANFSRDVLSHARDLAVAPVSGSGWSDWGSPARVFASLQGTECHERLVGRIRDVSALAS